MPGFRLPAAAARAAFVGPILCWVLIYPPSALIGFRALTVNAFDVSLFDYALWTTYAGPRPGYVPFIGHTLQAQHFMPTLYLLAPLHWLWPSPLLLVVVQMVAVVAAAALFTEAIRHRLPTWATTILLIAFLGSRKSHGTFVSLFYIESLEPALVFGFVIAATRGRWAVYWTLLALALGCKEDMAIYVGGFGLLLCTQASTRRQGLWTTAVAAVWLVVALAVMVPNARAADGLPPTNPFVEGRYGPEPLVSSAGRLASGKALERLAGLVAATGFLAVGGPGPALVASPGIVLNLAARPETLQAGLTGHYLWPILPWLFLAAAEGAARLRRAAPRIAVLVLAALCVVTVADSPLWRMRVRDRWRELPVAGRIRAELAEIPTECAVLAQPQLIPHLPHLGRIAAVGFGSRPEGWADADIVLLSDLGDQWPLTPETWRSALQGFARDPQYRRVLSALVRFHRQDPSPACAQALTKALPAP